LSYSLATLISYLIENGYDNNNMINFNPSKYNNIDLILQEFQKIQLKDYKYIAFSAYIWSVNLINPIIKFIRDNGFIGDIILGGYEISSLNKKELLEQFKDCQFFIESYAEKSLLDILKNEYKNQVKPLFLYKKIDFDMIPSPYLNNVLETTTKVRLETKRGCPFSCAFCSHQDLVDKKYHELNKTKVYKEIDLFKIKNVEKINIIDPVFNIGIDYIKILKYFIRIKFQGEISVQIRIDLIQDIENNEFLALCKKLNIILEFGVQTIFEDELKALNRKQIKDKARDIIIYCNKYNITYEVSLIYGLPYQTLDSFKEGISFFKSLNTKKLIAFPLMLLRGTELYANKQKYNFIEENYGKYNIKHVLSSNTFSQEEWLQMKIIAELL